MIDIGDKVKTTYGLATVVNAPYLRGDDLIVDIKHDFILHQQAGNNYIMSFMVDDVRKVES